MEFASSSFAQGGVSLVNSEVFPTDDTVNVFKNKKIANVACAQPEGAPIKLHDYSTDEIHVVYKTKTSGPDDSELHMICTLRESIASSMSLANWTPQKVDIVFEQNNAAGPSSAKDPDVIEVAESSNTIDIVVKNMERTCGCEARAREYNSPAKVDVVCCDYGTHLILNNPRAGKKLAVFEVEQTLVDLTLSEPIGRPYLNYFLAAVYKEYDIVLWSNQCKCVILAVSNALGLLDNNQFKIMCIMHVKNVIIVSSPGHPGQVVKSLEAVWDLFTQYNRFNTIMLDDKNGSFLLNGKNGILVNSFHAETRKQDAELLRLAKYLKKLARRSHNFACVDHSDWVNSNPPRSLGNSDHGCFSWVHKVCRYYYSD